MIVSLNNIRIIGLSVLGIIALMNFAYISKPDTTVVLDMENVECMAAPEWSSEYKYQAYGYCGPLNMGYKCVICKTGQYCSRYECLANCN